jgi:hypothetical protein
VAKQSWNTERLPIERGLTRGICVDSLFGALHAYVLVSEHVWERVYQTDYEVERAQQVSGIGAVIPSDDELHTRGMMKIEIVGKFPASTSSWYPNPLNMRPATLRRHPQVLLQALASILQRLERKREINEELGALN